MARHSELCFCKKCIDKLIAAHRKHLRDWKQEQQADRPIVHADIGFGGDTGE